MFTSGFVLGAYVGSLGTGGVLLAIVSALLWAKRRDRKIRRLAAGDMLIDPAIEIATTQGE